MMTVIFNLWLAFNALASVSATDSQLTFIAESKNTNELREAFAMGSALSSLSEQCDLEIKIKRVPVSCFAQIRLLKDKALLSSGEHERKVRAFSSVCRQVARANKNLAALTSALSSQTLSVSCRKAVLRRVEDLTYQVGEVRELDRFLN